MVERARVERIKQILSIYRYQWIFLVNMVQLFLFTKMASDFMLGWASGILPSLLYVPLNPPLRATDPVTMILFFGEAMACGYMWTKAIARLPRNLGNAFLGQGWEEQLRDWWRKLVHA